MAVFRLIAVGVCCAAAMAAGERVVLSNGFSLRVDRHEMIGDTVRLYSNGGVTEMPRSAVSEFHPEAAVPTPPKGEAKAETSTVVDPKQLVEDAAKRHGLPAKLLHSLARAESAYQQNAVSPKGAIGIMQLMPDTAKLLGADPADPAQNVEAGTRYLADLLRKYAADDYQVRKALAAYNAGPGAVERYKGVPPYRETMAYVERIIKQSGLRKAAH
ncbi:MAG TPA: lytic transglycosylase domain-containing protein [Bryobacteraceae bacterium]|nr:lytic transglycosylase domain-containing protein [Bryobacteraceae bacterium]